MAELLSERPNLAYIPGNEDGTLHVGDPAQFRTDLLVVAGLPEHEVTDAFVGWLVAHEGVIPHTWQHTPEPVRYIKDKEQRKLIGGRAIDALCSHPDQHIRGILIQSVPLDFHRFVEAWGHPNFLPENLWHAIASQRELWESWPLPSGVRGISSRNMAETRIGKMTLHKLDLFSTGDYPFTDQVAA